MTATIRPFLSPEKIESRIKELAAEISRDYAGKEVTFLVTLKGGVNFSCELAKYMTIPVYFEYIRAKSYSGTTSTGTVTLPVDVEPEKIVNKNIIIIEDIIDSGRTLSYVVKIIQGRNPASLKVCAFLDKKECRVVPFEGDYIGFTIENNFVVGFGLDVDQKFRNFPFVAILEGYDPEDKNLVWNIVEEANKLINQ